MTDKELEEILASIEGYTGKKLTPLDLTPEETILISPRLSEAKTKLLAWRDKAVQEARIEITKKYLLAQGLPETANLLDAVHKELK